MSGALDLTVLISSMEPVLHADEYVFCTVGSEREQDVSVPCIMKFQETEGTTLIVKRSDAERVNLRFIYPCKMITLNIHSSLDAIGFLAAIAKHLAAADISMNAVSAFYHDHIFVSSDKADVALTLLQQLSKNEASAQNRTYVKIRTVYFKITKMSDAIEFWRSFTGQEPCKKSEKYSEFKTSNINLGLVLNDFGDNYSGSNCCPVFEFADHDIEKYIEKAKTLGARIVLDALNDPNIKGVIFADPWGNEFEVTRFHD